MRGTDATDRRTVHMCSKQSHLHFISWKIEESRELANVWSWSRWRGLHRMHWLPASSCRSPF
jgi:hypothetical protein